MANLKLPKRMYWEIPAAIAIFLVIFFLFPDLVWMFLLIQIVLIIGGVFYYKFLWRCPHCKLPNPTLTILVTNQKVCDECSKKVIPAY